MRKAACALKELSADERTRDLYERREKARRDIVSMLREQKFEIAGNLLKRNRPIDEIIEDIGLTREEVESLS